MKKCLPEDDSLISKFTFMQSKHQCVSIQVSKGAKIRIKGDVGTVKLV